MNEHPSDDLDKALREVTAGASRFGHREHLHLAWLASTRHGPDAEPTLTRWLRTLAERHGTPDHFHATLTAAWLRLVNHHLAGDPGGGGFESFLSRNPGLLNSSLVGLHYGPGTLQSEAARRGWVAPDRLAFPG